MVMHRAICFIGAALLSFASMPAGAQAPRATPIVIHDAGGVSIAAELGDEIELDGPAEQPAAPPQPQLQPHLIFPVVTTAAKPGILGPAVRANLPGGPGVPICIVGDDQLSRHWLNLNRGTLEKMGASCLVASVRDLSALDNLRSHAGAVRLVPGSIDALAGAAGITVWPVLITPDGMISQ
jgi:integrating conjugative element protein (TIGR03765 family)